MQYTKGLCKGTESFKGCEKERIIVNRTRKLCQYCNAKRLAKGKPEKQPTGELALFQEIWNEREHKSQIDGTPLKDFKVVYFSHILSKGAYGGFRLLKQNIVLKTLQQHHDWEFNTHKLKDLPEWQWVFELRDSLKQKYYEGI